MAASLMTSLTFTKSSKKTSNGQSIGFALLMNGMEKFILLNWWLNFLQRFKLNFCTIDYNLVMLGMFNTISPYHAISFM